MTALLIILAVLNAVVLLVWMSRHRMIDREKRTGFVLTPAAPGPSAEPPFVSVLVAAKDEEACIETCVRTMLRQDHPNFEFIVCNDRSTDRTAEIVQRLADGDPRARLVNIERLPDGWCGKNNAMRTGISSARGEWLCMIDADCRQTSPRTLSVALRHAMDHDADLLSVLPRLEMRGFWENVVQPVCGGVMMIWFSPDKANDPAKPNAYANGAFILVRREAYDAIGGHDAVRDKLNEDMHLARLIKARGLKLRVVRSEGLYGVRMYTSLKQIIGGWSRIFYGTFGTLKRLTASFVLLLLMSLLPHVSAAAGLIGLIAHAEPAWPWLALALSGAAACAMQLSVIRRFYPMIGARAELFWTYPIGSAVAAWTVALALTKLRKGARVVWKSTGYAGMAQHGKG
jgi:cellulose synthase/poly-beta-1,6-N-acetylglucosamine synthase-like glycosyltransferase